ncbi:MAG: J domain-containing protein [Eubacteriales bacterium]|nr:J domain-containing protein [Eubacteriales bacterium]
MTEAGEEGVSVSPERERYEQVLLRRDNLRKEAEEINLRYIALFGELMIRSFELKIECIKKKKMIAYCQRFQNKGLPVDFTGLDTFITQEMASYDQQLKALMADVKTAKSGREISPLDYMKIKKIYYRLVKKIHPDLHPDLADDELLKDYWNRIVNAYQRNSLKDLTELEDLVDLRLEALGVGSGFAEISDIKEKTERIENEIVEIISSEPYVYKMVLNDPQEIEDRKQEFEEDIEAYEDYSKELDQVLSGFEIERNFS